jgi:hypothetical protein
MDTLREKVLAGMGTIKIADEGVQVRHAKTGPHVTCQCVPEVWMEQMTVLEMRHPRSMPRNRLGEYEKGVGRVRG